MSSGFGNVKAALVTLIAALLAKEVDTQSHVVLWQHTGDTHPVSLQLEEDGLTLKISWTCLVAIFFVLVTIVLWGKQMKKGASREPCKVERCVQSQTTYKWWLTTPRFVPLPDHSHGCW